MKKILSSILAITFCCTTNAEPLTPGGYLRKVSLHLQGAIPDMKDLTALAQMPPAEAQSFIDRKIDEYLGSAEFNKKMQYNLINLFRFNNEYLVSPYERSNGEDHNATDELFKSIIAGNKSWDELLMTKEYVLYKDSNAENILYSKLFPNETEKVDQGPFYSYNSSQNKISDEKKLIKAETETQKNNIAGVVTTNRFLQRYGDTSVNKSRRRAAAVFRIFLCDDMRPVLVSNKEDDAALYAMATNTSVKGTSNDSLEQKHANDPSCQSCHYKLDPMAKTFRTTTEKIQSIGSPGSLVYKRNDGSVVNIAVSGFGGLAKAIVQQPEYRSCQVRNFWNWFIGSDAPMDESMARQLEEKFDQLGRKPKDFVKYLLKLPIFSDYELFNKLEVSYNDVKPILQRCDKCHEDLYNFPSFSKYPMGENRSDHIRTLQFIDRSLDLAHDGKRSTMPPLDAGWKLTSVELNILKKWIKSGAQFDANESRLNANEVQLLTANWKQNTNLSLPSFDDTYLRYQRDYQVTKSNTVLNNFWNYNNQSCFVKPELWGRPMADSGRSNTSVPSPIAIQAYKDCVKSTVETIYTKIYPSLEGKSQIQMSTAVINAVIGPQVLSKRAQEILLKKLEGVAQSAVKIQPQVQVSAAAAPAFNSRRIVKALIAAVLTDYNFLVY